MFLYKNAPFPQNQLLEIEVCNICEKYDKSRLCYLLDETKRKICKDPQEEKQPSGLALQLLLAYYNERFFFLRGFQKTSAY